jgi:hypothetical protein
MPPPVPLSIKILKLYLDSNLVLIRIIQFDNLVHIETAHFLPNERNNLPTHS